MAGSRFSISCRREMRIRVGENRRIRSQSEFVCAIGTTATSLPPDEVEGTKQRPRACHVGAHADRASRQEEASSRAAPDEPSMRPLGGSRAPNAEALGACGLAACPTPAARRDVTLFYSALKCLSFKSNAHLLYIIIHI